MNLSKQQSSLISISVVLIIAMGATLVAYWFLLKPQNALFWDEAHHARFAWEVFHPLRTGGLGPFLQASNRMILWPPVHSMYVGLFFYVFNPGVVSARLSSLVLFLPTTLIIYLIGQQILPDRSRAAGLITVLLFVSSPLILFFFATCMIEGIGVFLTAAIIALWFSGIDQPRTFIFIISGFLLFLLYLTKYNYGILILTPLAIDSAIELAGGNRSSRIKTIKNIAAGAAAFLIPLIWWYLAGYTEAKFGMKGYVLSSGMTDVKAELSTVDNALFYVRSLANIYTFSVWVFLIYIAGLVYAITRWKLRKVRLSLIIILISFIACSVGVNKQDRYLILAFPPLTALGAGALVHYYRKFAKSRVSLFGSIFLAGVILLDLPNFINYCRQAANHTTQSFRYPVSREIDYSFLGVAALYPGFLKQPYNYLNPKAEFAKVKHTINDVYEYLHSATSGIGAICCLSTFQEFSPHQKIFYSYLRPYSIIPRWEPRCLYFAYVEISPNSPYANREYYRSFKNGNVEWIHFLESLASEQLLDPVSQRVIEDSGLRVRIFKRTSRFPDRFR